MIAPLIRMKISLLMSTCALSSVLLANMLLLFCWWIKKNEQFIKSWRYALNLLSESSKIKVFLFFCFVKPALKGETHCIRYEIYDRLSSSTDRNYFNIFNSTYTTCLLHTLVHIGNIPFLPQKPKTVEDYDRKKVSFTMSSPSSCSTSI